ELARELALDRATIAALGTDVVVPRVLITRAADQAGELLSALRRAGLEPVLVPAIAIEPAPTGGAVDRAAGSLRPSDWAVVTTPNGAWAVLAAAERTRQARPEIPGPRSAAIGDASCAVL